MVLERRIRKLKKSIGFNNNDHRTSNSAQTELDSDQKLLSKYSKFFIDIKSPLSTSSSSLPLSNNNTLSNNNEMLTNYPNEFDAIIENETNKNGGDSDDVDLSKNDTVINCGITQWELQADAILAKPVTRFAENPITYPSINATNLQSGIENIPFETINNNNDEN